MALAGIAVAVVLTDLSVADIFACILAFIPTGWMILSVSFLAFLCSIAINHLLFQFAPPTLFLPQN